MTKILQVLKNRNLSFLVSKSNLYNGLIQLFTIAINLLLMPLLLNVLGKDRFGIWQTILSLIGYVAMLNFGMGNGLRNTIAKYYAEENFDAIGNLTGQTITKLVKIIFCFILIVFPLYVYFFEPLFIFKNIGRLTSEVKLSIAIFLLFFLINIISSLSSAVSFGLNKSYLPGLFNVIYLILVYITLFFIRDINLKIVSLIFGLLQLIVNSIFFVFLLIKYHIKLSFTNKYELKETASLSRQFFVVQILSIIFLTIDNFVISNRLGPSHTAEYAVVSKIYFTLISIFSILLISFWNAVTIAFAKKDLIWIKRGVKQLLAASIFFLLIGFLISLLSEFILKIWFGDNNLNISKSTFLLFSIFTFLHCLNAIFINLQNGIGDMKIQMLSTSSMIVILLVLLLLFDVGKFGYNLVIIIKIFAAIVGIAINFKSLKHIK